MLVGLFVSFNAYSKETVQVLTINARNTLVIRNVINSQTVAKVQEKANRMSQNLAASEPIYLFLDTPGGSIDAGNEMITNLIGLKQKVHTITNFAASMGFITAQSLGTRYILPNGILMSHRASGGAEGQIPGELNTRVNFFTEMLDAQDEVISARVKLTKTNYQKLVVNEYWTYGAKAVRSNMADKVILVRCNKELSEGKVEETVNTFFGPVIVTYSTCPLVTAPLKVSFSELLLNEYNTNERTQLLSVQKTVLQLLYDKRGFYHDYIINNKYRSVFP